MGSVGGLASSSKKLEEEALKIRICLKMRAKGRKGTREDDASLMKEKQESPSPKPVKRKSNSLQVFFGLVSLVAFSKRFFIFIVKGDDLYDWSRALDQFSGSMP